MNLLFLTFAYLPSKGGVQRSVSNLAAEMIVRGNAVTIATDGPWSGIEERGLEPGSPADVLVLHIPTRFYCSFSEKMRCRLRDAYNIGRLVLLCLHRRIDVVHCHLINVDTSYGVVLRKLLGIRLVITLRGDELSTWIYDRPYRIEYVQTMLREADAIAALSQGQIDDARILAPGLSCAMRVIPNPLRLQFILDAVDEATPLPASQYLVYVGRLVDFKSLDILIAAYHQVIVANPAYPADLVLVGTGNLDEPLLSQAQQGEAAERIHFLGERPWGQCLRLAQQARCLILPSHDSEGCPNVLLEAMALGTPVIVSDNSRLLEMVTAGENGEVFACRDAGSLQDTLERFDFTPERRARYAEASMSYLERRHGLNGIIAAYEQMYEEISAAPKRAR